TDGER
ncbi:hypothetical protein, partial [Terribacillus sp. AE2B 122]